jgi:flagellar P-ring protein precursor FlgI
MTTMRKLSLSIATVAALVGLAGSANADRLKDVATVEGVRSNQLTGFGLVVGLGGTGDDASSPVIRRSLAKMLKKLGTTVDASEIKSKNVAAVVITAELPPFARPGQALDVTVSSMGSAKSLAGGTLIVTPLKGPDGKTWALAQGPVAVGGFLAEGGAGSQRKNHVTVARIPGGALVEADAPTMMPRRELVLVLRQPDFTTASRVVRAIDATLGAGSATARDAGAIAVPITRTWDGKVPLLVATLEAIEVDPDMIAKVVVDEKTGTVVVGGAVRLRPAAIAYGGLSISIGENAEVSQPGILSGGETKVVARTTVETTESAGELRPIPAAASVGDVAAALNTLGVKPRDLIAILQALHAAGALRAEIEVL